MPRSVLPGSQLHAAALAALTAGHVVEARRLVAEAIAEADDLVAQAQLARLRARVSMWSGRLDPSSVLADIGLAEQVAEQAPELAAQIMCDAALIAAYVRQLPLAEQLTTRALELTGGEGLVGALAATGLGIVHGLVGRFDVAGPLLARADELVDPDGGVLEAAELLQPHVLALMVQERYDDAISTASGFLVGARRLGALGLLPLPLCLLAQAAWKAGRWEECRLAAAEALPLAAGTQELTLELYAEAVLSSVAGAQGREQVCRERVARVQELTQLTGVAMFRVTGQLSMVHLFLGLDRPGDALPHLAEVDAVMQGARRAGMLNWHADHIDVLIGLGRLDDARVVLARMAEEATGNRWEQAAVLRCRGQLEPDDARAVALLEESVEAFDWQPYEQARSRLRLAQRLDRAGLPGAVEEATQARLAFTRLRATGWLAQTEELVGAGAPRPSAPAPATSGRSGLEVRLLGGFTVLRDGEPVALPPGTGAQAVKFVALRGGRSSADELVEALWPEAEPGRGRARLRNVLTRLRRDGELLVRDGDEVALPTGAVCDVPVFVEEATRALSAQDDEAAVLARRAVDRYAGELLPADRYSDWTSGARERLRGRYLQLLDRLADEAAARGAVDEALTWWEQGLDVEPYDEDRYVAMAALLVRHGRTGPANRVVRRAMAMLTRLGVEPSGELGRLATQVGA